MAFHKTLTFSFNLFVHEKVKKAGVSDMVLQVLVSAVGWINYSRWFESYINPHATSGDDTGAKSLMKHLSTRFVTAKT